MRIRAVTTDPIRVVVATAMGMVVALVAGGIFDRFVVPLLLPPLAVGIATLATPGLRWIWRLGVLVGVTATSAIAVAFLSDGGVTDAAEAVVQGPRRVLTTEWPSPVEASVVVVVGIVLALLTATAAVLAGHRRWRLLPLVPLAVATVTVIALGAPRAPAWWLLVLLGAGALVLALLTPGEVLVDRVTTLLGDRTLTATIVGVALIALGTSAVVAADDRSDPRRIEEAEAQASVLDPIEASVALRRAEPPLELFEITDRSTVVGRALPARWRLAALDVYDGQRWVPQVTLRPIGERLGLAPPLEPGDPPPITYDVTFLTDDLDLVPFPGRPLAIDLPVETDVERVAVRLRTTPSPGTTARVTSLVAPSAVTVEGPDRPLFARRPVDEIAQTFVEQARELAGDGDLLEQLTRIETTMRTEWTLDRDVAGGGQQLALLQRFVGDTQRGTREQFVTAFVLFARALGVDARVATGFVIPPDVSGVPLVIQSEYAAAWPEVRLAVETVGEPEGVTGGWLAFDPVPVRQEETETEDEPPPEAQSPAAAQPPIEPPAEETEPEDDPVVEPVRDEGRWAAALRWAGRVGVTTAVGLLPLVLVAGTILAVKWWRRRRRLRHPDPSHRVRGAWANVTDSLVDAGLSIGPAWTDDRIARGGIPLAPSAPHELRRLAAMATAMTFGARDDAWRLVDDARATSRSIDAALRAGRSRWQRIRWRLSLRSLRRRSRSPVVP